MSHSTPVTLPQQDARPRQTTVVELLGEFEEIEKDLQQKRIEQIAMDAARRRRHARFEDDFPSKAELKLAARGKRMKRRNDQETSAALKNSGVQSGKLLPVNSAWDRLSMRNSRNTSLRSMGFGSSLRASVGSRMVTSHNSSPASPTSNGAANRQNVHNVVAVATGLPERSSLGTTMGAQCLNPGHWGRSSAMLLINGDGGLSDCAQPHQMSEGWQSYLQRNAPASALQHSFRTPTEISTTVEIVLPGQSRTRSPNAKTPKVQLDPIVGPKTKRNVRQATRKHVTKDHRKFPEVPPPAADPTTTSRRHISWKKAFTYLRPIINKKEHQAARAQSATPAKRQAVYATQSPAHLSHEAVSEHDRDHPVPQKMVLTNKGEDAHSERSTNFPTSSGRATPVSSEAGTVASAVATTGNSGAAQGATHLGAVRFSQFGVGMRMIDRQEATVRYARKYATAISPECPDLLADDTKSNAALKELEDLAEQKAGVAALQHKMESMVESICRNCHTFEELRFDRTVEGLVSHYHSRG